MSPRHQAARARHAATGRLGLSGVPHTFVDGYAVFPALDGLGGVDIWGADGSWKWLSSFDQLIFEEWHAKPSVVQRAVVCFGGFPKFTSQGSYPIGYIVAHDVLCASCATEFLLSDEFGTHTTIGAQVNWEDPELHCTECEDRIESAYADD